MPAGGRSQLKPKRLQQAQQQFAVGLLVVNHQHASARPGVAQPGLGAAQAQHLGRIARLQPNLWQKQLDAKHRTGPRCAAQGQLAAHQVGEHLGNRQAQTSAGRGNRFGAGHGAAAERLKNARLLLGRQTRPGVGDVDHRHLTRMPHAQTHPALRRELDGVAQQVDQDLAHPLFVAPHHGRQAALGLVLESQALGLRLQLEHGCDFDHQVVKVHRSYLQREFAALDVGNVERALDQRQQVLATAPDHRHRLLAVRRDRGVFTHELGIAQDAVERRAQLVADGADVAAFGLVGLVSGGARALGQLACGLQLGIGLPVRFNLAHQQMGLPVGFFLRHLPALVRQHHPPGHQPGDHQKGQVSLDKTRVQGRLRRQPRGVFQPQRRQAAQLLVVQQAKHTG